MKPIVNIFWNSAENRLRALVRIVLQILLMIAIILIIEMIAQVVGGLFDNEALTDGLYFIGSPLAIVLSVMLAGRFFDKRPFSGFGLHLSARWWKQFWFGMALGAVLMCGIFLVEYLLGYVTITDTFYVADSSRSFAVAILEPLLLFLAVGFYEELLFRGYYLRNIAEGFTFGRISAKAAVIIAVLITSGFFGFAHGANPNADNISTINITMAGILLAAGLVFLDELAIPIGLHISWNFFQGNVFGFPVSGTSLIGGTFIRIEQGGPTWLTGSRFGPESGLLAVIAMLFGLMAIIWYARMERGSAEIDTNVATFRPNSLLVPDQD